MKELNINKVVSLEGDLVGYAFVSFSNQTEAHRAMQTKKMYFKKVT